MQVEDRGPHKFYYYDDCWQKPVITEYRIFQLLYKQSVIPVNYFAFPWATLIDDFISHNKPDLINILRDTEIRNNSGSRCCTVVQHVLFRRIIFMFRKLNITHIFTSHRMPTDSTLEIEYNIKIIPMSLYPIYASVENTTKTKKYLLSFIGFYDPKCYMSNIREKIIQLYADYPDCYVLKTYKWHFYDPVYKAIDRVNNENTQLYCSVLSDSVFSLCPSGSGPNSIRLWESLSYGSIPVILSDNLVLPTIDEDLMKCVIIWPESNIKFLREYLLTIDDVTIQQMQKMCINVYKRSFSHDTMHRYILEYKYN